MRKIAAIPALLFLVACTRPEVEAFRQRPTPITVTFESPRGIPRHEEVSREYAAAIRARLATRATVVPEGMDAPADGANLRILITEIREGRHASTDPSPAAVGVTTGIIAGALSAMSGNRHAAFDGFWWGLWAGTHAAASQRPARDRLGYVPRRVEATVELWQRSSGASSPLHAFEVGSEEVIDAMDPLSRVDAEDEGRIREEEARAFSRVVVEKLQEQFGWISRPRPSFYGVPAGGRDEVAKPQEPTPRGDKSE